MKTKSGTVLAVEKRVTSPLLVICCLSSYIDASWFSKNVRGKDCLLQEPSSVEKVAEVDEHIGVAMSGLTADARTLIDHARAETQARHQKRAIA